MSALWKQLFLQILLLLIFCRHINTKTTGPTPAPLNPISPLPTLTRTFVLKGESHTERIELVNPVSLVLLCTWAGHQNKPSNITGFWKKDGDKIPDSHITVQLQNKQYNLERTFSIESEEHLGCYTCAFGDEAKIDFVLAVPQIGDLREKATVSYVGDSVGITCIMEKPKPIPNTWNWFRENGTEKEQIVTAAGSQKYKIENDGNKTKLLVYNLTEADSGMYYCGAVYNISTTMGHVELKVITFFEPLKPFIAIVAEVIVLVAAILLYEKSRSKKDYSAAENTANDQANSLTPGENSGADESSSMRQRKV